MIKLLYMALRELIFKCFEMCARALSCLAAFLQQALMCCEKHNLWSIVTPRTFTSVSDMRDLSSRIRKTCCAVGMEENSMKWNLSGLACIPLLANHSIALRPSHLRLDSTSVKFSDDESRELSSAQLYYWHFSMKRNKSFMKMLKRRGPSMEPWGTPFVNTAHELLLFEILTRRFLPRR